MKKDKLKRRGLEDKVIKIDAWIKIIVCMMVLFVVVGAVNMVKFTGGSSENKEVEIHREKVEIHGESTEEEAGEVLEERSVKPKEFKSSIDTLNYTKISEGKAREINYKDVYKQEGKYLVMYTHEKCKYCMDFWTGTFGEYMSSSKKLPIYVVDLAESSNMVAWDEYDIEGIPYLMVVDNDIEDVEGKFKQAVGLKNSEELVEKLMGIEKDIKEEE